MAVLNPNEVFFTAFEPKQANRFILFVDGFPSYIMKGVSSVSVSQGSVTLNHINVQRYVKGKTVWNPISMTLFDPITPSGAQAVMEWVRLHHESVTGRDGYSDFYKKDLTKPSLFSGNIRNKYFRSSIHNNLVVLLFKFLVQLHLHPN